MKSRDAVIRLKRFEVDEKRRKVAEIEAMIGEFNHMATDLDRQIAIEQERAGVSDVNHYSYPTFAKAAIQRRDNLATSVAGLEAKLAVAQGDLEKADDDLKKIELVQERDEAAAAIAEAENDLEQLLLSARRAGVPPGWIRQAMEPESDPADQAEN